MGKLRRVRYTEPEPWVPSGGFEPFRSAEQAKRDAEEAARSEAEWRPRGDCRFRVVAVC